MEETKAAAEPKIIKKAKVVSSYAQVMKKNAQKESKAEVDPGEGLMIKELIKSMKQDIAN